jgi:hypothetical protein
MTLDLGRLSAAIRAMGEHLAAQQAAYAQRVALARALLRTAEPAALAAAGEAGHATALPLEPPAARHPLPPLPPDYQVLATDGSQIEPDRHGPALWYLLNIGWAVIQYGATPWAELASAPQLYYRPEDLYVRDGARQAPVQGSRLDARRSVAEMEQLAALAARPAAVPRVALSDGFLLLWAYWEGPEGFVRDHFVAQFQAALRRLQAVAVPVAGYISRPRGADVVTLLRQAPPHQSACGRCRGTEPEAPCALDGLADRLLFDDLAPGERSALFESQTLARYYPPELLPRFFYLNVGREVARVELPAWAAVQPDLVARVHAVVVDQCRRGLGYPVVLARAHEQAVVGGADRQRVEELIRQALVVRGLPDQPSAKQASKRVRAV